FDDAKLSGFAPIGVPEQDAATSRGNKVVFDVDDPLLSYVPGSRPDGLVLELLLSALRGNAFEAHAASGCKVHLLSVPRFLRFVAPLPCHLDGWTAVNRHLPD